MATPTTIHFVNHASYIQRHRDVRLLVDPWTSGDAFHHGWSLLAPTATSQDTLNDVTHIWVSHEHPDHFAPAFFRTIPEERRRQITALYQTTKDRKVIEHLAKAGYRTLELEPGKWTKLGPEFEVMNEPVPIGDSYLVTRAGGTTIVNVNDCTHLTAAELRRLSDRIGAVDVLFTQFGYASWQGRPEDTALRKELAKAQLDRVTKQVTALRPKYVVPFASFVYFSAQENDYLNDANNKIADVDAHLRGLGVTPIVLFPADEWVVGEPHDNASALARWTKCEELPNARYQAVPVPVEKLRALADDYAKRMLAFHSPLFIRTLNAVPKLGFFGPIGIYVTDHEQAYEFSIYHGLRATKLPRERCAATMHSETLGFLLQFDWGLNTLSVNGRFTSNVDGFKRLVRAFGLGTLRNEGRRFSVGLLADASIWGAASRAFFQRRS